MKYSISCRHASRRKHLNLVGLLVLACPLFWVGCQTDLPPLAEQSGSGRVKLMPGDVVRFAFPGNAESNQVQKIRADGRVTLPVVGELTAAGKTLPQFQSELTDLYKTQLTNSEVVVTLEGAGAQVYITGAVSKPGKMVFDRPTTILQVIMEAGGPTEFGSLKNVRVIRLEGGQQRAFTVDLRTTMAGATTRPRYVKDGDVISVPATSF